MKGHRIKIVLILAILVIPVLPGMAQHDNASGTPCLVHQACAAVSPTVQAETLLSTQQIVPAAETPCLSGVDFAIFHPPNASPGLL